MIYIHSYSVGKFGNKQIRNIYDTLDEAMAQQRVLGGVVQAFESVEDIEYKETMKDIIVDEVSCLIDDMSNHSPYSPWENPGSPKWDSEKIKTLNNIRELLKEI